MENNLYLIISSGKINFYIILKVLPTIPKEQRTRVAHFLEKQGFKQQALAVSSDPEHRFELAIQLSDLKVGPNTFSFAEEIKQPNYFNQS